MQQRLLSRTPVVDPVGDPEDWCDWRQLALGMAALLALQSRSELIQASGRTRHAVQCWWFSLSGWRSTPARSWLLLGSRTLIWTCCWRAKSPAYTVATCGLVPPAAAP